MKMILRVQHCRQELPPEKGTAVPSMHMGRIGHLGIKGFARGPVSTWMGTG